LNKKPALDNTASLKTTNILNKKPALDNTPSLKTTKILNEKPTLDNTTQRNVLYYLIQVSFGFSYITLYRSDLL
jgi:hypothetical protein